MRFKCFLLLSFLVLLGSYEAEAFRNYIPKLANPLDESIRWTKLKELDGHAIRYMAEGSNKTMWISSNYGILSYDGYSWTNHKGYDLVTDKVADHLHINGETVYATNVDGIFQYEDNEWSTLFDIPKSLNIEMSQIIKISDERALAACTNWGLFIFKDYDLRIVTSASKATALKKSFPNANIIEFPEAEGQSNENDFLSLTDVLETEDSFWLALTKNEGVGEIIKIDRSSICNNSINAIEKWESNERVGFGDFQKFLLTQDGNIWVINFSSNKGIAVFDGTSWETISLAKKLGGDEVMFDILQSEDGTIWISGLAAVNEYKNEKWYRYSAPQYPIPANRIRMKKSSSNELWIAGYKSNMVMLDLNLEDHITYEGLSYQFQDAKGAQWFLSEEGEVVVNSDGKWIAYDQSDDLLDAPISMLYTSKEQIWVTGSDKGIATIALFENGKWSKHSFPELSWSIDYRAVFESSNGTLWFGGAVDAKKKDGFFSGVVELRNPTGQNFEIIHHKSHRNGLNKTGVYGIAESPDGKIWIGGSRLLFYDGLSWQESSIGELNQFVNVVESTEDLLLVGSRFYGVFLFDGTSWTNYTMKDGLSSNTIISIEAISDDNIIVATENGICRFDGVNWAKDLFPEEYNLDFEGGSIIEGEENSIWINHVSRSWNLRAIYNKSGVKPDWKYHTTYYNGEISFPQTKIGFYQQKVSTAGKALITWDGSDYFSDTPADELTYSYQIDNEPWSPFTSSNQVSFENLAKGRHSFKVKARDRDFNIDPSPASVEFSVLAPVWQRLWFIILMILVGALYGCFSYKLTSKRKRLKTLNSNLVKANEKLEIRGLRNQVQNNEIKQQRDQLELLVAEIDNLSKAKVNFFTNISHELRTPLSLIIGPAEQLVKDGAYLNQKNKNRLYSIINRNALRLVKLIDQLLEIRRIEECTIEIKNEKINLSRHVKGIVDLFEDLALRRNIKLEFQDELNSEYIYMDPDKLEKITVNLLSNSFKHTSEGDRISVSIVEDKMLNVKPLDTDGGHVKIVVSDTGVGISEDNMEHIFKNFYTSDQKNNYTNSSGIGLQYVKELIGMMNGKIDVASDPDLTQFVITLPYYLQETNPRSLEPSLDFAKQESEILMGMYHDSLDKSDYVNNDSYSVLIVDDDEDILYFLESALKGQYQVYKASNGLEGLKMVKDYDIDLVISDVMMPKMNGFDFVSSIRSNFKTSHIPIIILSAKALEESVLEGYNLGTDSYLSKPFRVELLLARIRNLLKQRRDLREIYLKDYILSPKKEVALSEEQDLLYKLSKAMDENYADSSFNVDSMCKLADLSHMHFIRKIKQLTGKKPIDLLKSYRMNKAKELLMLGKYSIGEVAHKVGFDIPNSFSRAFKKEFDISPSKFVSTLYVEA